MQRQGRLRRIRAAQGLLKSKQTVKEKDKDKGGVLKGTPPFFMARALTSSSVVDYPLQVGTCAV